MTHKPLNPILAALNGAVVALLVCFALAYIGVLTGFANPTSPAGPRESLFAAFPRAALNVYAMHHVTLSGSGEVSDVLLGNHRVSDTITLPLTVWFVIPAIAIFIGGYAAGAGRRGSGTAGVVLPAMLAGIIYAGLLAGIAGMVHATLDPSAIPAVGDVSFNPHDIALSPDRLSALLFTGLFGLFYAYLGAMISCRKERIQDERGVWWGCVKAVIWISAVIQLVMILGFGLWLFRTAPQEQFQGGQRLQFFWMAPTVSGIGYTVVHGLTLTGGLSSEPRVGEPLGGKASLYTGTAVAGMPEQPKPLPDKIRLGAAPALVAICAFFIGMLAFVWGTRDGAFPAAFRSTLILAALVAATAVLCGFGWMGREPGAVVRFTLRLLPDWPVALAAIGFMVFAFIGASFAGLFCKGGRSPVPTP